MPGWKGWGPPSNISNKIALNSWGSLGRTHLPAAPSSSAGASFHTHRLAARSSTLRQIFSVAAMARAWKVHVREGLRDQEVADLHDYNDFHWDKEALFANLHAEIMGGRYRPQRSLPVRVEKRLGVARTLVVPSPEDAIVLQCIVEHLLPLAIERQPSDHAFFSRSHGFNSPEIRYHKDYIWFRRWVKFSRIRLGFTSTHECIITTDIANYFDNIDYSHLRNILTSFDGVDEVTMDILFMVLDAISWRPDYLPPPGRSLPQVNFDAPRLLSHVYLYELDAFLKRRTGNAFVRWVDDITVAVETEADAKSILREMDQLLLTRGLRLNSGKTQVLSASSARKFFHQSENDFLDEEAKKAVECRGKPYRLRLLRRRVAKRFDAFVKKAPYGHSSKIIKRYISLFSTLRDPHALNFCLAHLPREPELREAIWRYLRDLGPSSRVFRSLQAYVLGDHALDDSSLFEIAKLLTQWEVTPNSKLHREIRALGIDLSKEKFANRNPFYLLASIWLISKYGLRTHLGQVLSSTLDIWRTSEFLSRQVASTLPKFRGGAQGKHVRKLLERHQFPAAMSVVRSLDSMIPVGGVLPNYVRLYVLNGRNSTTYSLQRFLLCLHVLRQSTIPATVRRSLRLQVLKYMSDPIYVKVVRSLKI